jgi:hypothetical protein
VSPFSAWGAEKTVKLLKLDEAILEELERGPGTVLELVVRLSKNVRASLERMHATGRVSRETESTTHETIYSVPGAAPESRR